MDVEKRRIVTYNGVYCADVTGCHFIRREILPSQTFFNLSEEKRQRIIRAAYREFSKHSLNNSSIAQIVKTAGIARGSFYQYFEDKNDLYLYLVKIFQSSYKKQMIHAFEKNQGHFYKGFLQFGHHYIDQIYNSSHFGFYKNLFEHMNYKISYESVQLIYQPQTNQPTKEKRVIDFIDRTSLKLEGEEDIIELLKFLLGILNQIIMHGFWAQVPVKKVHEKFEKRVEWIYQGVCPGKFR